MATLATGGFARHLLPNCGGAMAYAYILQNLVKMS